MLYQVRKGLECVEERVQGTGRLRVVYVGGSVTVGASASDHDRLSWRALTSAWLAKRYPEADCSFAQGGISGTNSTYGVYRIEQLLSPEQPDLVFIEFAVNDSGNRKETIRAVEGMVRKIQAGDPKTGIVLVYCATQHGAEAYRLGETPANIRHMVEVASHYGLPSVNLCLDISQRLNSEELAWSDFAGDTVHPYDAGHRMYAEGVAGLLEAALQVTEGSPVLEPYDRFHYGGAQYVSLQEQDLSTQCSYSTEDATGTNRNYTEPVEVLRMQGADAGLQLRFTGTAVGLLYLANHLTGGVRFAIDHGPWASADLHDGYRDGNSRIRTHLLEDELTQGEHVLNLQLDSASAQAELRIVKFLINRT